MLEKALKFLAVMAQKKEELLLPEETVKTKYGNYSEFQETVLYDADGNHYYSRKAAFLKRQVSNIESFIALVDEEAARRDNVTGEQMTVCFNKNGGFFDPDDNVNEVRFTFDRCKSQQWSAFSGLINKKMGHSEIIEALQVLSPSIQDFNNIFRNYAKLRVLGNSELSSTPEFLDGEAGEVYVVNFKLASGGNGSEELSPKIQLIMPYAKGSKKTYTFDAEIRIAMDGNNKFSARIICPNFENIEELAISDEVEKFKEEVILTELLILEDY